MKCLYVYLITLSITSAAVPRDICETCVPAHKCPQFGNLSKRDQQSWMEKFPCRTSQRNDYEPADFASQDYVCCSNNIWGGKSSDEFVTSNSHELSSKIVLANTRAPFTNNQDEIEPSYNQNSDNYRIEHYKLNGGTELNPGRSQNYDSKINWLENNNGNILTYIKRKYWNDRPGREWNFGKPRHPDFNYNNQDRGRSLNNFDYNNPNPHYPDNKQGDSGAGQCFSLTSFPPDPQSGCCGWEVADDDRITDQNQNALYHYPPENTDLSALLPRSHLVDRWLHRGQKQKRAVAADSDGYNGTVTIEKRISGGKVTEFHQYPWTVRLLITVDYENNRMAKFNCGGSLISAKYVLSAAHCVYDREAIDTSVEVYLAEYDKRTFPKDCKLSHNRQECIQNIVMDAEDFIIHPQYDNTLLRNDVSLIRLQGTAPYTEYIRPICLPSINIDRPELSNLQLEVAGWGLDGPFTSNVKQSTFLHLVNQKECKRFYPRLTTQHLCAAGHRGADTCKGDSGSPLITLYRGQYFVAGIVSGKREDAPCGTPVPSLYTNVYYYLDWIQNNIRN